MKRRHSLILSVLLLLAAAGVSAPVFVVNSVRAAQGTPVQAVAAANDPQPVEAAPLTLTEEPYFWFDGPRALYADDANLFVSDEKAVNVFTLGGNPAAPLSPDAPADALVKYGNLLLTLENGSVKYYDGQSAGVAAGPGNAYAAMTVCGDKLYAAKKSGGLDAFDLSETAVGTPSAVTGENGVPLSSEIRALTATDSGVVFTVKARFNAGKEDIYLYEPATGALRLVYEQSDKVLRAAVPPHSGAVILLTRGELLVASLSGGTLKITARTPVSDASDLAVNSSKIYLLTDLGSVVSYPFDLSARAQIVASASGKTGFFNTPTGLASRRGNLYVADTANDRVAVVSGGATVYLPRSFTRPSAVAVDSMGSVYVSHDAGLVEVFDSALSHRQTLRLTAPARDLKIDAADNLWALTDEGIFSKAAAASDFIKQSDRAADCIGISPDSKQLYTYASGTIARLTESGSEDLFTLSAAGRAVSFCVDIEGSFYFLSDNGSVVAVKKSGGTYTETVRATTASSLSRYMVVSTVENGTLGYGDLVIADTGRHILRRVEASAFGVKVIDDSFVPPDVSGDDSGNALDPDGRILRTALTDLEVFPRPMEMSPSFTVKKGRTVIVAEYDVDYTDAYSFILVDDTAGTKLVAGYVYKNGLSDPIPYEAPPAESGKAYNVKTPVYKWPSRNSLTVEGYNEVEKGTPFALLHFAPYRDDYGLSWYRVVVGETMEGYILATNLSIKNYEPELIRPQTNAVVVSVDGSTGAIIFELAEDDSYRPTGDSLPTGTKVEVVGGFDPSVPYTKIKYFDEKLGTLTCYVETQYLEYKGVNTVQIVAVILIVLTVILAAVIIARIVYLKKHRPV